MCNNVCGKAEHQATEAQELNATEQTTEQTTEQVAEAIADGLGAVLADIAHAYDFAGPNPADISIKTELSVDSEDLVELKDAIKLARKAAAVSYHVDFHSRLVEMVGTLIGSRNLLNRPDVEGEDRTVTQSFALGEINQIIALALIVREELRNNAGVENKVKKSASDLLESLGQELTSIYTDGVNLRVSSTLKDIASTTKWSVEEEDDEVEA